MLLCVVVCKRGGEVSLQLSILVSRIHASFYIYVKGAVNLGFSYFRPSAPGSAKSFILEYFFVKSYTRISLHPLSFFLG